MSIVRVAEPAPHPEWSTDAAVAALVVQLVAVTTGVPAADILGRGRSGGPAARARQVCMYLTYVTYQWPLARVGAVFGRDRTTAGWACRQVEDMREDPAFDAELERMEACLRAAPPPPRRAAR